MNEQLLKTSGADVLSYRNKTQKKLQGSGIHAFENNCLTTQLQKIKVTERKLKS